MTNFSTNQVMQFYVVDSAEDITILPYKEEKAFKIHFNKLGVTSDKIENVEWATHVSAENLSPKAKITAITFASDVVVGQDYIVKVSYPEIGGAGAESWTTKTAVAHAGKDATKETVVAELIAQLTKVLGVDGVLAVATVSGDFVIAPNVENVKYERGVRPITIPDFNVTVNQVIEDGELTDWATLDNTTVTTHLPSGYKLADMEYFAMGERGDEYRMAAYPNHIVTDYKIVPAEEYDVYNVHYSYKGYNNQSHKAEKDLIIAVGAGLELTELEGALDIIGVAIASRDGGNGPA